VVPITSGLGLIEWVGETKVLKEVMQATQEAVQVYIYIYTERERERD
jgi:hypothetical protein